MSDTLFYVLVSAIVLGILALVVKPVRELIFKFVGAKSIWGLLWSMLSMVFTAHIVVIKNFLPRSIIYPTLDDRRTTNAED